jgi:tetratricopeptide (TPR) repeat protein
MKSFRAFLLTLLCLALGSWVLAADPAPAPAAAPKGNTWPTNVWEGQWHKLIDAKDFAKAASVCADWLKNADVTAQTEGHKCLASVAMADGEADAALQHFNTAIKLSPGDLSSYDGRLQLLIAARRFEDLPKYVEMSIKDYPKSDGLEEWLNVSAELLDQERYEEGLAYTKVLEKHYPKDYRVVANVGTFLAASKKNDEALSYLKRAVEMKPDDPLDNWNLGKVYDQTGKIDLADKYYRKSLAEEKDPEQKKESDCAYSEFLKKNKRPGAGKYEKEHCPGGSPDDD